MAAAPLTVEQVGRRYSRNRPWALRGVSLDLHRGSITALVGPNGAGKSTLIRACIGFERPEEGRVLVEGTDPQRDRPRAIRALGYVPQAASLYRALSIDDHLTMAKAARPSFDREYALQRLSMAGLEGARRVGELSGGEQAQVALALALGCRAPLLLLDEPMASLDPLARRDFLMNLTTDVRDREATALLSSHIVTDIEQACDRLIVLARGGVVLDAGIASAKRAFRVTLATAMDGAQAIGRFASPDGQVLALIRSESAGRAATLEEIVLGHLASVRPVPVTADRT
jgi:ABC-2 type transport system ATP-binding protein